MFRGIRDDNSLHGLLDYQIGLGDWMRILAIQGAPGTGKSTLLKSMLPLLGKYTLEERGLVKYMEFEGAVVLGYYEEGQLFGGVDRLAMNVQEDALNFLHSAPTRQPDKAIIWEGDRLSNAEILRMARKVGELRFVELRTSPEILQERRETRSQLAGKSQNEIWVRGRESKVLNLSNAFNAEKRQTDSLEDSIALAKELVDWVLSRTNVLPKRHNLLF